MRKAFLAAFIVTSFSTLALFQTSWGAKGYVLDPKDIPMRSGPGTQYRVIATIPSGSDIEILKSKEWVLARFEGPNGETKDGWVLNSSIGPYPPDNVYIKELQQENLQLKERLQQVEKHNTELGNREAELKEKLKQLQTAHEELKKGSTNYLKLKEEYDTAKVALSAAEENIQVLLQENDDLKFSERIRWFGMGGLVLFCGWAIGWFSSRSQKKRRAFYTF